MNTDLPVVKAASIIIDDGKSWIFQVRNNIDGILWPGKVALWGGSMEPEDEGSFLKNAQRELKEETGLTEEDVELTPLFHLDHDQLKMNGKLVRLESEVFVARMKQPTFFHVYEGTGSMAILKSNRFEQINTNDFAPGVIEALERLTAYEATA